MMALAPHQHHCAAEGDHGRHQHHDFDPLAQNNAAEAVPSKQRS
jgi:hypothetical protein